MRELIKELIEHYELKRSEFIGQLQVSNPKIRTSLLNWNKPPRFEEVIENERVFFEEVLSDISGFQKIKGKLISDDDWKSLLLALKNHNERLASYIDNCGALVSGFALLSAVMSILASSLPVIWLGFAMFIIAAMKAHDHRVEKRHELSRNRELINLINAHIKSHSGNIAALQK